MRAIPGRMFRALTCLLSIGLLMFSLMTSAMLVVSPKSGMENIPDSSYRAMEDYTYSIGVQAYIYGLAPVIIQRTEQIYTTTPGPGHAPVNQFGHIDRLATPNDTIIVTPNSDTIYSIAWLELGKEPVIMHVPDTAGRYYVMQLLDAYTNNFNSIGRRTTGTKEGDFAITGPGWSGSLPAGVSEVKSPTDTVWVLGRILVEGQGDLPDAAAIQKQFTLTPLSEYGKPFSYDHKALSDYKKYVSSRDVQKNLTFFEELRVALKNNPPPKGEEALMAVFDAIGLGDNETPYGSGINPIMADGLGRAIKDGDLIVKSAWKNANGTKTNGWVYPTDIGTYGYDYLTRAAVAEGGLGANVPAEAIYAKAQADENGKPLSGTGKYVMHFARGNLPPVDAFWSLTMYNATTYMLVANPEDRYAIGDRTPGLQYNPDGSLDIYIQHDSPAGEEPNWLPSPADNFYLILRMYQPGQEILKGKYQIPTVKEV